MGRCHRNSSDDCANDDIDQTNVIDEFAANIPVNDDVGQEPSVVKGGVEWGEAVEYCLNVLRVYAGGMMFMDVFDQDNYTHQRTEVPWYPFASQKDWEVAYCMSEIDEYLNLSFMKENSLLFHHTKELCHNPQLADCIDFDCWRVYKSVDRLSRVYSSFMMGNHLWYLQCQIPQGASLLGVILSSNKTKVTNISSNRYAYPVLISLANIASSMHAKASLHTYLLVALIPVLKFVHSNVRVHGILVDQLFHQCLSIVTEPLKAAAKMGIMMNNPIGNSRYCFMPLVSYVADTPEEILVACVCSNVSPVTTTTQEQFGDPFRHPLHKGSSTLARIKAVLQSISHADVSEFFVACKKFNLNGIYEPFWLDWPLSDSLSVHNSRGSASLSPHFLGPQSQLVHFHCRISSGLITAAVPSDFLSTVRSLCEFHYLAQALCFTEGAVAKVERVLQGFHTLKEAIVNAGAQRGKSGENKLWAIPKLELLQGVVPSLHSHGSVMQWSADPMECAHIDYVKVPGHAGNNHDYNEQVCHYLDCQEKCQRFALALETKLGEGLDEEDEDDGNGDKAGGAHHFKDYFEQVQQLIEIIVNVDPMFKWPHSHLEGHCVGYLCLIFHPIIPLEHSGTYLAYVECLDVVIMDPAAGMHVLKCAQRLNDEGLINDHSSFQPLRFLTLDRQSLSFELKHAHQMELADATIYEPEGSNSDDNCQNNWIPCALLPDLLDERLLSYLETDDGQHLYDVARKCWNPAFLPPLLCQPGRKDGKGKKKASPDVEEVESDKAAGVKPWNDEEVLADFFNRIMKSFIKI
ncbi:hypothetical protein DFH29DRAFT_878419 [Suillus ampliporus]|nr:hypothetical protein DFH29DRAFT_878419 [Suillus ampliporus]